MFVRVRVRVRVRARARVRVHVRVRVRMRVHARTTYQILVTSSSNRAWFAGDARYLSNSPFVISRHYHTQTHGRSHTNTYIYVGTHTH